MDVSRIALFLGNVRGAGNESQDPATNDSSTKPRYDDEGIAKLSENARYVVKQPTDDTSLRWKGADQAHIIGPVFALTLIENMYSTEGWTMGSSDRDDVCDIQLVKDHSSGVSRRHLLVDLAPDSFRPRIKVLSKNPVQAHRNGGHITLYSGEHIEVVSSVKINMGKVSFEAWLPTRDETETLIYRRHAQEFSKGMLEALPRQVASVSGTQTFTLRFGQNGVMYKIDDVRSSSTGSFGTVMRVTDNYGRLFAAKEPHYKANDDSSRRRKQWEDLKKEFETLIALRHRNIVSAVEIVPGQTIAEPPWLIMEWVDRDLESIDLDRRDAARLTLDLTDGLQYLHRTQTHRDIKPGNILVQMQGQRLVLAKIADFGTAKWNNNAHMNSYEGTSMYMAPELRQHDRQYTKAVDLWSLGVLLALSTLTPSLRDEAASQFMEDGPDHWISTCLLPSVKRTPSSLTPLLLKLLARSPNCRWTAKEACVWSCDNLALTEADSHMPSREALENLPNEPVALQEDQVASPADTIEDPEMYQNI
ncbi:serine/threonine protein kinase [Recurvomyces mirabilis]|uniref:Serine/threonine protein kinase n=1 Tax=Recurvomyces mirabilis TaxID=574656 RepID=A0AAE0TM98_9PEZI|nr:serine/threonine protein kinase [Recurvomyces mirabilis]